MSFITSSTYRLVRWTTLGWCSQENRRENSIVWSFLSRMFPHSLSLSHFPPNEFQIGTSSVVYPAAGYASMISERNIPVVEINIETTPSTSLAQFVWRSFGEKYSWEICCCRYHFHAPAAQILPQLLSKSEWIFFSFEIESNTVFNAFSSLLFRLTIKECRKRIPWKPSNMP